MKNLSWPAVALVAVLGALALGLLALTDLSSGEVLGIIGVLAGVGGGAALAGSGSVGGVQRQVESLHQETAAQTETLDTVARRVNGELDARIEAAVDKGTADVIKALRVNGVIR